MLGNYYKEFLELTITFLDSIPPCGMQFKNLEVSLDKMDG